MGLDIRWPIGLMFTVVGALLALQGLLAGPDANKLSLGININFGWGCVLLAFGLLMVFFAWRGKQGAK
ncbi:MAG: hypothetical protein HZC54_14070 [Verrucomicrobia bacterium]|nr:hypothetical protein [Verrucomicrobiota bacterium]